MSNEIREAMLKLAEQIRAASKRVKDGYYDDDAQRAVNSARREALDDVAIAIDAAFDVNSVCGWLNPPLPED